MRLWRHIIWEIGLLEYMFVFGRFFWGGGPCEIFFDLEVKG